MDRSHSKRIVVWTIIALAMTLYSEQALAQLLPAQCNEAGLTHRMALCIRQTIDQGALVFIGRMEPFLRGAISAVLTLSIILYGVLLSFGMIEKAGRDTMVLVIKLAAVISFVTNGPLMLNYLTTAMDSAALSVVTHVPANGTADNSGSNYSQTKCLQNMVQQQAAATRNSPWLGVDCLLDTIIGIKMEDVNTAAYTNSLVAYNKYLDAADRTKTNSTLARGLLFFLFSSLETSIVGAIVGIVGFFFIYGMLMMVARAFFTYIAGYMGVAFLVIVSPILIPMVLFKETKQYFDKWVKLLVSFTMQPVITLLFIVFALTAIDLSTFSSKYSVMYRIAGDESLKDNFDLNTYLTTNEIIKPRDQILALINGDRPVLATEGGRRDTAGSLARNILRDQCTPEALAADPSPERDEYCKSNYPIKISKNAVDWEKLASTRVPPAVAPAPAPGAPPVSNPAPTQAQLDGQQALREVMAAMLFSCMVVFILNGLLAVVPMIAQDLMGDFMQSPGIVKGGLASPIGQIANKFRSG